jgi:[acyl-carrier-protein] S-malonyltransferase
MSERPRIAFLFPGQGARRVHEALRAVVRTEAGRAICELASGAAEAALARMLERASLLDRTDILQPVLTAISLHVLRRLSDAGIAPDVVLGHSLGEVAAWAAAGGLSPEETVRLAALRGRLMAREAAAHPGGMVALATADAAQIEAALAAGRSAGTLCLAARNAPDETVLSGDEAAVRAVLAFAPQIATRVPTSGAWHSPAMAGAVEEWRAAVTRMEPRPLRCAFIANRTGDIASPGDIPDLLAEQLVRPVEWARSLAAVRARVAAVVTIGPGAVLRSLWHKNQRDAALPLLATDDERSLAETIAALQRLTSSPPPEEPAAAALRASP